MKDYKEIDGLLHNYFKAIKALKDAGITSNKKDFTSQLGEWLVAELYEGTRAINPTQKHWDIDLKGKKIQVKTHAKAATNKNRWSPIKYDLEADVNTLVIVVFTEDYNLREFYVLDWQMALPLIKQNRGRHIINWNHLEEYRIEVKDLPNQELITLFTPSIMHQ